MSDQDQKKQQDLINGFDQWAQTYDQEVLAPADNFPFAGYAQALTTVWEQAAPSPGMSILDLGVGTGNLSQLFADAGCQVLGVDFSAEMLAKTSIKLPQLDLVQVDLTLDEWPAALNRRFDRIVSNYVFHEFPLEMKLRILTRLARNNLAADGRIVIGDIIFPTTADLNRTRTELADAWEEEFYWAADETRMLLEPAGWKLTYLPTSFCAGVTIFTPPADLAHISIGT